MSVKNQPLIDWREIESSAPAKFIISGEYSVVYEKQAIASTIDLKTTVTIRPNKEERLKLILKNLNETREWPIKSLAMCRLVYKFSDCLEFGDYMLNKLDLFLDARFKGSDDSDATKVSSPSDDTSMVPKLSENKKQVDDAIIAFLLLYVGISDSYAASSRLPIDVEISSNIPVGSGLGSSSAYAVALCAALMRVFRVSAERHIISKWAYNIDKFFHGKPSGVDNNVITNGGFILFQSGKLKSCMAVRTPLKVMFIDTGVSRSTRALGAMVTERMKEDSTKIERIFSDINDVTTRIWRELNDPNFVPSNIAVDLQLNQELLDQLGVGHEKLTDICMRAQRLNLTAKQTGAGGGGSAFVLYNDSEDSDCVNQLRNEFKEAGYYVHDHSIGCDGVTVKINL